MSTADRLGALRAAAERELREDILPYWSTRAVDREQGGFFGAVSVDGRPDPGAGKGGVLNARILWTFSAALRRRPEPIYREMADRAFDYLLEHFWDPEHSGLYWEVDHLGRMLQGRKQTYGQAFGIYALAEYFRATGVREALDRAVRLFEDVETHALDPSSGGYWEARGRDWRPIDDIRLSDVDLNAPFSMNNHLHLLEAYTTLALVCEDPRPRVRLRALLELVLDRILDAQSGHLILFFDEHWRPMSGVISYGHDIETSWLICEAACVVGDPALVSRARAAAVRMADAVLAIRLRRRAGRRVRGQDARRPHQHQQGMVAAGRGGGGLPERLPDLGRERSTSTPPPGRGTSSTPSSSITATASGTPASAARASPCRA